MTDPSTHNEPELAQLARDWLMLKGAEESARKRRIKIEEAMLPFLEQKAEGSTTSELDSGHKVTVTNKMNRKLDFDGFNTVRDQIPKNLRPVKVKEELDDRGARWLQQNEPQIYALIAPHLTVTPAKPGIKVVAPITEEAE